MLADSRLPLPKVPGGGDLVDRLLIVAALRVARRTTHLKFPRWNQYIGQPIFRVRFYFVPSAAVAAGSWPESCAESPATAQVISHPAMLRIVSPA
jgi:hypothetical protein